MESSSVNSIGRYAVIRALTPDQTFLAADDSGRQVVIKFLDADCLLRDKLHPSIHDRLARVRELAHVGVANLIGIERSGRQAFAVWQYIPGKPLDQYAGSLASFADFARVARDVVLAVESLHLLGIVHGRIHAGNVIIDDLGKPHLTHISPLLYDDLATDIHDLAEMFSSIAKGRGWADAAALRDLSRCETLPRLRASIARLAAPAQPEPAGTDSFPAGPRRRFLFAAVAVAFVALAFVVAIAHISQHSSPRTLIPPDAPRSEVASPSGQ